MVHVVVVMLPTITIYGFDRGAIHVVVVILSTITVSGFDRGVVHVVVLYCLQLLFKVLQWSG